MPKKMIIIRRRDIFLPDIPIKEKPKSKKIREDLFGKDKKRRNK